MALKGNATSGRTQIPLVATTNAYTYVGSYTHTFSAASVLHVQGGRTYEARPQTWRYNNVPSDIDAKAGFPTQFDTGYLHLGNIIPGVSIQNGVSETGEDNNSEITANSWSVKSDFIHVVGRHTFKLGGEYNGIGEQQSIEWATMTYATQETASNQLDSKTGNGVASFVLGIPNKFTKRNLAETISPGGVMGYYLQDQWQMNPKLTVNFGIRYDLALIPKYGTPAANNQSVGNFDFNSGTYVVYKVPGSCASTGNAPCIPTADGSLPTNVVASPDGKVFQNQTNNFQPRIGAAYRITPTLVIHGGFGVAFDNYAALVQNVRGVSGNWPSVGQIAQNSINVPVSQANPFPGYTTQNLPAMTALPAATPFNQNNWFVDPKMKDAYSLQWNFGVQRQLDSVTVVSATYVGSENRRLSYGGFYNTATTPGAGAPRLRSPYPYIAPTYYSMSTGEGTYNALQVQLTRSFHNGLAATVAYSWSKSIDEGCSGFFGSEGCNIQQIYNPKAERSVSAFDVPQNLVATWNYALPIGRGKAVNTQNRVLDLLVGGWQYSGFAKFHSGNPYNVTDSADIANIGTTGYIRPNITVSPIPTNRTAQHWLNYWAFSDPGAVHLRQHRAQRSADPILQGY